MKRLIFVRHAEAEHHIDGRTGGWTDSHLTLAGQEQAGLAAARLARMIETSGNTELWSSDLSRAEQTARILGARLGLEVTLEPGLREINNGQAANKTREEAAAMEAPQTEPTLDWIPYPEAESWRMMVQRVLDTMRRISELSQAETIIAVGHGLSGQAVVCWWLGLKLERETKIAFDFGPTSITDLYINQWDEQTIGRLNDTGHLS